MSTGYDFFDTYGADATPTGYTKTKAAVSCLTRAAEAYLHGYGLDIDPGGDNNGHDCSFAFTLDALNNPSPASYIELLVQAFGYGDLYHYAGVALCVSDDGSGNMSGYDLSPRHYVSNVGLLRRVTGGTVTVVQSQTIANTFYNHFYRVRARFFPSTGILWWKQWTDAMAEPGTWQTRDISADTPYYSNGRFGIYKQHTDNYYVDFFSWGIDEPAPAPEEIPDVTAPTIAAAATDVGEITISETEAGTGADSYALYTATTGDDLPEEGPEAGATLQDDDWDGSDIVLTGLGNGATRYARAYAIVDEAVEAASNLVSATTLDEPTAPVITANASAEVDSIAVEQASGGEGATVIALYGADFADDLSGDGPGSSADLLDADWDGSEYVETSIGWGVTRYYAAYATNDGGTTRSNVASDTTIALPVPGQPSVSAEADSYSQFTATITPGEDADDHELYVAFSPTDLFVPANLYTGSLGAAPAPVAVTDRLPGYTYYVGVRASNEYGDTDSAIVSVNLPDVPVPTLVVNGIETTQATLNLINVEDDDADEVQYQTTLLADTEYASPVEDITITEDTEEDSRFVHPIYDLTADTDYRSRVRYRTTGGAWSEWIEETWSTSDTPPESDSLTYFVAPGILEIISGTYCFKFALEKPHTVVSIEISDDNGETWTPLSYTLSSFDTEDDTWEYLQFCIDTTTYADGDYKIRITLDDETVIEHHGFDVSNSPDSALPAPFYAQAAFVPMATYRHPSAPPYIWRLPIDGGRKRCVVGPYPNPQWVGGYYDEENDIRWLPCSHPPIRYVVGRVGQSTAGSIYDSASYGPIEPAWLADNLGADVQAVFFSMTSGGSFYWSRFWGTEVNFFGIGLCNPHGNYGPGFSLRWSTGLHTSMFSGRDGCSDYFSHRAIGTAAVGSLMLQAHEPGGTRFLRFMKPVPTSWGGWLSEEVRYTCHTRPGEPEDQILHCVHGACGVVRPIPMRLRAWRPDPEEYPRRWQLLGSIVAPALPSPLTTGTSPRIVLNSGSSGPTVVTIAETVDLDWDVECGGIVFLDHRVWGQNEYASGRFLYAFKAVPLEGSETCEPQEIPPEVDCSVSVVCYDVTMRISATAPYDSVRYQITTAADTEFANPILDTGMVDPEYYEDPEFGPTGTATYTHEDLEPGNYLARISVLIDSEEYACDDEPFTVETYAIPAVAITSPTPYTMATWDRVVRWTGTGVTYTVEYKITGGDWVELTVESAVFSLLLSSEEDAIIGGGPVIFRICAYSEDLCEYLCVTTITSLLGVRRILFGEPGPTSVGLEINEAGVRRIIFGQPEEE